MIITVIQYHKDQTVSGDVRGIDPKYYVVPEGMVVVPFPESWIDRNAWNYTREEDKLIYTPPVEPEPIAVPNVRAFTEAVLSNPESVDYLIAMSDALDLMERHSGRAELMKLYWDKLKVEQKMSKSYIEFVEEKAKEFNIPVVELK